MPRKLDLPSARAIRRAWDTGAAARQELAARWGVSVHAIDQVLAGETWPDDNPGGPAADTPPLPETDPAALPAPGTVVVDAQHGVSDVLGVEERGGCSYLALSPRGDTSLRVFVPVYAVADREIRPAPGLEDAGAALAVLDTPPDEELLGQHWHRRRTTNEERMTAGLREVAAVVRDQAAYIGQRRDRGDEIAPGDLRQIEKAEKRLLAGLRAAGVEDPEAAITATESR